MLDQQQAAAAAAGVLQPIQCWTTGDHLPKFDVDREVAGVFIIPAALLASQAGTKTIVLLSSDTDLMVIAPAGPVSASRPPSPSGWSWSLHPTYYLEKKKWNKTSSSQRGP